MKIKLLLSLLMFIGVGFVLPEPKVIPVQGATSNDWNSSTFWYEPWGSSGVHKGIDIFANSGVKVIAATHQLVLYRGEFSKGGKVVLALGPKWRLHYYAHLATISDHDSLYVAQGSEIGTVGRSGNAVGKPAHLHYSILSLIPMPWRMDTSSQGYKKAFYLNPISYLCQVNC